MSFSIYRLLQILVPVSFLLSPIATVNAEEIIYGKGLFWKIEKADRKPSYILGTMHVSDPRVLKIKKKVEPFIKEALVLNLEIDLTPRESREANNARLRDDGQTLDQVLPPELYEKIRQISKDRKIAEIDLKQLELWAVYPIIKSLPNDPDQKAINSTEIPLDFQLGVIASSNGVEVNGLETVREQLSVFRERDQKIFYDAIVRALETPDVIQNSAKKMEEYIGWYVAGDTNAFYQSLLADLRDEPPEMYDIWVTRLLNKRNVTMANGMVKGLVKGNSFTAVGALHLPGEKGILQLLVDRGYTLTPMD